jgi:hypothetical protein
MYIQLHSVTGDVVKYLPSIRYGTVSIIEDDRTLPADGKAKLRVVQAAQRTLDVSIADGPVIASGIAFTTATGYQGVDPGAKTLRVQPTGGRATTVQATMTAGSIYSLLVLEATDGGVSSVLLTDAQRQGTVPRGGVNTGAGGTAPPNAPAVPVLAGVVLLVLLGAGLVASRTRRSMGRP